MNFTSPNSSGFQHAFLQALLSGYLPWWATLKVMVGPDAGAGAVSPHSIKRRWTGLCFYITSLKMPT